MRLQRRLETIRDHFGREDWVIFCAVFVAMLLFGGVAMYCWGWQNNTGATVFASAASLFFGVLDVVFWFVRRAGPWQR